MTCRCVYMFMYIRKYIYIYTHMCTYNIYIYLSVYACFREVYAHILYVCLLEYLYTCTRLFTHLSQ